MRPKNICELEQVVMDYVWAHNPAMAEKQQTVAARAVKQIIDKLCGGSVQQLLVGMVNQEVLDPEGHKVGLWEPAKGG